MWAFDGGCGLWLDADGVLAAQGTAGSSSIVGQTPADLLFAALDADGDGVITKDEMRKGLTRGSHSRRNSGAPKRTKSSGGKERAAAGAPSGSGGASGVGLLLSQSATTRPVALRMAATSDESESQYGPPKSSAVAQAELKKRLKVQGKLLEEAEQARGAVP